MLSLFLPSAAFGNNPVIVDGRVDDWGELPPAFIATPAGIPGSAPILKVWAAADGARLLMRVELSTETNPQSDGDIVLFVDADGDRATGQRLGEIGADFRWEFAGREGRAFVMGLPIRVQPSDVGLRQAPTVSARVFEISVDLEARVAGGTLFSHGTPRIVLSAGAGKSAFRTPPLRVSNLPTPGPPPPASLSRRDPSHLRVLTYNVLFDGFFKRREPFARILRAIDPDIILFQEIMNHTAEETQARVVEIFPEQRWEVVGSRRGMIASRVPIKASGVTGSPRDGVWAILDRPGPSWKEDVVLMTLHPPCCEDESGRQAELDSGIAWIRDSRASGTIGSQDPLIIAGDMNLVGSARQLATLLEGAIVDTARWGQPFAPDADGSPLADAFPSHQGEREVYTWRNDEGSFSPGRLDYIVYSDARLELGRSFVLWTPDMTSEDLTRLGLHRDDTAVASDHLPVVADFAPRQGSSR